MCQASATVLAWRLLAFLEQNDTFQQPSAPLNSRFRLVASKRISTMQLLECNVCKQATATRRIPAVHQDRPGTSTRGNKNVGAQLAGDTPRRGARDSGARETGRKAVARYNQWFRAFSLGGEARLHPYLCSGFQIPKGHIQAPTGLSRVESRSRGAGKGACIRCQ
jgi:hypothetical protein